MIDPLVFVTGLYAIYHIVSSTTAAMQKTI